MFQLKDSDKNNKLTVIEFTSIIYDELKISNIKKEELYSLI